MGRIGLAGLERGARGEPRGREAGRALHQPEQAQVGRRAGQRRLRAVGGRRLQQEARRPVEAADALAQARRRVAEAGGAVLEQRFRHPPQRGDLSAHRRPAVQRQLAGDEIDRLDAVGALVDAENPRVAHELRRTRLLHEAHAAMHLHAERGHLVGDVGGEGFRHRRQQRGAVMRLLALGAVRRVESLGGEVADAAGGRRVGLHDQQHALHVRVGDDGADRLGRAGGAALAALAGIVERLLERGLGHAHALQADIEPGRVHHREHAGQPPVLLADEPADGAAVVAEGHGAGRRGVDAELVLDSGAAQVVAGSVRQHLRHEEERDAAGARGRILEPGQHEVADVVGKIVLAVGDVDLGPGDPVAAVALSFRTRAQGGEVRARLRLGQVHGRGPLARDELCEVALLQFVGAVGGQRLDAAGGEQRAEAEGEVRPVPHLGAGGGDEVGQALAAMFGRGEHAVPATLDEGAVGRGPARRGGDGAVGEGGAVAVARAVQGRDHVAGEPARLFEDGGHVLGCEFGAAPRQHGIEPRHVAQREGHLLDRRAIAHGLLTAPPTAREGGDPV